VGGTAGAKGHDFPDHFYTKDRSSISHKTFSLSHQKLIQMDITKKHTVGHGFPIGAIDLSAQMMSMPSTFQTPRGPITVN